MMVSVYNNTDERCCVGVLMGRGSHLTPFPENRTTAHRAASQDWDSASFQTITGEGSGSVDPGEKGTQHLIHLLSHKFMKEFSIFRHWFWSRAA